MPEEQPAPSLIQQRMTLSRGITAVAVAFGVSLLLLAFYLVRLLVHFPGAAWWVWTGTVCHLLIAVYTVVLLVRARSRLRAFESRHGRDAGRQRSVT